MEHYKDFLKHISGRQVASGPAPFGLGYLVEQIGLGFEFIVAEIQRLEQTIMTSAQSSDATLQAIAAALQTVATDIQTAETTLSNDLATAVADIQQVVSGGGTVQKSTLDTLTSVQTALQGLAQPLTTAVGQLDAAVNPAAPAPAPAPSGN